MEVGCLKVEGEKVRASTMRRQTAPSRGRTLAATGRDISAEFGPNTRFGFGEYSQLSLLSLMQLPVLQQLAVDLYNVVHLTFFMRLIRCDCLFKCDFFTYGKIALFFC